MREYVDRLAAKDDRGDAVRPCEAMTIRSQPQLCGIDDRLIGMLMLHVDHFAGDPCRFRCARDNFLGLLLHTCSSTRDASKWSSSPMKTQPSIPTYDVNDASDGP